MTNGLRACIISLGRSCDGEIKRVDTWRDLLQTHGIETIEVQLLASHRRGRNPSNGFGLARPFVPEAAVWSEHSLLSELKMLQPDIIIPITARCWSPRLLELDAKVIFDFVDRLSVNYRIRASHSSGPKAAAFRLLALEHAKAEATISPTDQVTPVYAGYGEASRYQGTWVPNLSDATDPSPLHAPNEDAADLLFFGALYTPINVDAVETMARHAQTTLADRSVILAGRRPTKRVHELAEQHGWTLIQDFPSVSWLSRLARVSVAPLGPSTGIQNKIIEAGAMAMPTVSTHFALAGLSPEHPLAPDLNPDQAVRHAADLARSPLEERQSLGRVFRSYVERNFRPEPWGPTITDLVSAARTPDAIELRDVEIPDLRDKPVPFLDVQDKTGHQRAS